jgi:hypothetical protein
MDAETMKLARQLGMQQTTCEACKEPTLFIMNKQYPKVPRTCGRWLCGVRANELWAR